MNGRTSTMAKGPEAGRGPGVTPLRLAAFGYALLFLMSGVPATAQSGPTITAWSSDTFNDIIAGDSVSLHALVRNAAGQPVSGAQVQWSLIQGGGSLSATSSATDASGRATVTLT